MDQEIIGLNDTQCRILTIIKNIGGKGEPCEVQQKGSISKPIDVIEMNMRQMVKSGHLEHAEAGIFRIKNKDARTEKRKRKKMASKNGAQTNKSKAAVESLNNDVEPKKPAAAEPEIFFEAKQNSAVGEIEDDVMSDDDRVSNIISAIDRLEEKARKDREAEFTVIDFQLKYDVLSALMRMTCEIYGEDSISDVLGDVRDDITYMNAMQDKSRK